MVSDNGSGLWRLTPVLRRVSSRRGSAQSQKQVRRVAWRSNYAVVRPRRICGTSCYSSSLSSNALPGADASDVFLVDVRSEQLREPVGVDAADRGEVLGGRLGAVDQAGLALAERGGGLPLVDALRAHGQGVGWQKRAEEAKAAGEEGRPGGERVVARAELGRVGAVRGCARRGERLRESEARAVGLSLCTAGEEGRARGESSRLRRASSRVGVRVRPSE